MYGTNTCSAPETFKSVKLVELATASHSCRNPCLLMQLSAMFSEAKLECDWIKLDIAAQPTDPIRFAAVHNYDSIAKKS